ncbi:MAG: serine hydrolase domain-containing protein [Bacteroidia bacterium]
MRSIFSYILLILVNVLSLNAQTPVPLSKAAADVDKLLANYNFNNGPGLAVAVIRDGEVVYEKGMGIANLEYHTPITAATVFQVASVSKQFTVFAILLLEQEGKLNLNDDIRKYLPELPDYGHVITIQHLANHTSGLRDITALANITGTRETDLLSNDQAVKLITSQLSLNFTPGDEFEYSNSGYILLAEIVKRVSGQTFATFAQSRIFESLNMKNSQFIDDPEVIVNNRAYSYYQYDSVYYKSILNHSFVGSTGLNTNTDDLCLWAMNFEKKIIGNEALFSQMIEKSRLNDGTVIPYGLGLENRTYKGLEVIFHGGGIAGYGSYILRVPAYNFSIVYMCNSHVFHPLDIVYGIVDCYLADKEKFPEKVKMDHKIPSGFTGDYEIFPGYVFSFSIKNDTLFQSVYGDTNKIALIRLSNNEFSFPAIPHSRFVFSPLKNQSCEKLRWHISDFSYVGKRVALKKIETDGTLPEGIVGLYYNAELNSVYRLEVQDGKLVAVHSRNGESTLTLFQPNLYVADFGALEFIYNNKQEIIGFNLMVQGIRKMKFEKLKN